jgi:hypothetical protein
MKNNKILLRRYNGIAVRCSQQHEERCLADGRTTRWNAISRGSTIYPRDPGWNTLCGKIGHSYISWSSLRVCTRLFVSLCAWFQIHTNNSYFTSFKQRNGDFVDQMIVKGEVTVHEFFLQ